MVSQVAEELMRVIFKLLQSQGIEKKENPMKLATIQTWYRVKSCSFRVPNRTVTTLHEDPEKNEPACQTLRFRETETRHAQKKIDEGIAR
jgi:hypothetical protein